VTTSCRQERVSLTLQKLPHMSSKRDREIRAKWNELYSRQPKGKVRLPAQLHQKWLEFLQRNNIRGHLCNPPSCQRITVYTTCERCRNEEAGRLAREAIAVAAKVTVG
jgi:hypothetical protein